VLAIAPQHSASSPTKSVVINADIVGPHGHAKPDSIKNRVQVRQAREKAREEKKQRREEAAARRKYNRQVSGHGTASTSTFQKAIPGWWSPQLLQYRKMVLSEPALNAYYEACLIAGHYIGGAGYRSHSTQAGMTSSLAAPPGYSYHEIGLALDVFGLSSAEEHALLSVGFQPLQGDPGHYSYRVYG